MYFVWFNLILFWQVSFLWQLVRYTIGSPSCIIQELSICDKLTLVFLKVVGTIVNNIVTILLIWAQLNIIPSVQIKTNTLMQPMNFYQLMKTYKIILTGLLMGRIVLTNTWWLPSFTIRNKFLTSIYFIATLNVNYKVISTFKHCFD